MFNAQSQFIGIPATPQLNDFFLKALVDSKPGFSKHPAFGLIVLYTDFNYSADLIRQAMLSVRHGKYSCRPVKWGEIDISVKNIKDESVSVVPSHVVAYSGCEENDVPPIAIIIAKDHGVKFASYLEGEDQVNALTGSKPHEKLDDSILAVIKGMYMDLFPPRDFENS